MNRQRISWLTDMDGVIVQEDHLVPGADRFVARLAETGHPFLILHMLFYHVAVRNIAVNKPCDQTEDEEIFGGIPKAHVTT